MPEADAEDDRARPEPVEITLEFASDSMPMLVTELGANRYRLEEDPFWGYINVESARDLASLPRYGDDFEASGGHDARRCVKFVKVVKRSGLKRFQFLIDGVTAVSPELAVVVAEVEELNGYWERICGGIVIMYVPRKSRYDPLKALNRARGAPER